MPNCHHPSIPVAPQVWHEPENFHDFRCTGAACEDLCCAGWGIGVDELTYGRYQTSGHPELGPKFKELVQLVPNGTANQYATIRLNDSRCPFLSEQLCGVQKELGEELLGLACATFPRVVNEVEGAVERSLDVSCPEAARIVLLNPKPIFFKEFAGDPTPADLRMLEVAGGRKPNPRTAFFNEVRSFAISMLQNRAYPIAKRMLLLGHFCAKLTDLAATENEGATLQVIEGFALGISSRLFDPHLQQCVAAHNEQLAIALELTVERIRLDYTSEAYRNLYRDFSHGLRLKTDSTIAELAQRYASAYFGHYAPFMEQREHIFENYLVSYAYKNLFPCGTGSAVRQYLLLASYFAVTRTLAVGLAGHHGSALTEAHVVGAIQVCARALEHCTSYPARVLEILQGKGITTPAATAVLTQGLQH